MSSELSYKCRTCLSKSNFFHQLFDYVNENYKILEMLDCIVPQIDIKCNTQFPTLVCQPCVDKLLTAYKFQQLCIETNNRLHDTLNIASFETDPKLEKVLDPLTGETNLNMKQEVEEDVCYKQEITPNELEMSIRSDNDDDWEPLASSASDSKEMLRFQCPDCLKCFERKTSLSAHYKVHREKHDNKLLYKAKKVDTTTKNDQNETPEIANNTQENEPRVCVKEEYEITPQIIKENVNESQTNGELFNNNNQNSYDESDKDLFLRPVKSPKDVNFIGTVKAKIKKPNSKNHNYPCEVCGRLFNRLFNLKRHDYEVHKKMHANKLVYKYKMVNTSAKVDKIETPDSEYNTEENEPGVCVKEEYEITPQIFKEAMDESETNCELLNNISADSDSDESDKDLFVNPVKSTKAKIKKHSSTRKSRNYPCEVCGRVFNRLFNLRRHDYKVHKKKHDKLSYKDKMVDTSTKVDKTKTPETENNTEESELRVCVKEEYEIISQISKENINESETHGELFNNNSEDSDAESDNDLFVKQIKSIKVDDFIDTGVAKIKKFNSSNRKSFNYPCKVCGRIFNRLFNLKRHDYEMHREKYGNKLVYRDKMVDTSTKVDKIDAPEPKNNRKENEPIVYVKNKLEITPQILGEPMDEFEENCELFSNDSEYSDSNESDKDFFVKPVKSTKDADFVHTAIAKRKNSKRKRRIYSCEVCGKVFDRIFNLKRHCSMLSVNDVNIDLIDTDVGEIEKLKSKSRNF